MNYQLDPKNCTTKVFEKSGWGRGFQCQNKRKYGNKCGTHDPERIKVRREARGPTRYEIESAAIRRKARLQDAVLVIIQCAWPIVTGDKDRESIGRLRNALVKYDTINEALT